MEHPLDLFLALQITLKAPSGPYSHRRWITGKKNKKKTKRCETNKFHIGAINLLHPACTGFCVALVWRNIMETAEKRMRVQAYVWFNWARIPGFMLGVTVAVSCMQLIGMQGQCWQSKLHLGRDAEQRCCCCCCCRDMTATVFLAINPHPPPHSTRHMASACVLNPEMAKFSVCPTRYVRGWSWTGVRRVGRFVNSPLFILGGVFCRCLRVGGAGSHLVSVECKSNYALLHLSHGGKKNSCWAVVYFSALYLLLLKT